MKKIIKYWVSARVKLTDNLDAEANLCNGSEDIVKYIHKRTTTSSIKDGLTIYVQFDNLPEELRSCGPILVKARKFFYIVHGKNKSNLIFFEYKPFPIVLAYATVIHKTHSATLPNIKKAGRVLIILELQMDLQSVIMSRKLISTQLIFLIKNLLHTWN